MVQPDPYSVKEAVRLARRRVRWETRVPLIGLALLVAAALTDSPALWFAAGTVAVSLLACIAWGIVCYRDTSRGPRYRRAYQLFRTMRWIPLCRWLIRHGWIVVASAALVACGLAAFTFTDPPAPVRLRMVEIWALYTVAFGWAVVGIAHWIGVRDGWDARCPRCEGVVATNPLPLQCPSCKFVLVPRYVRRGRLVRNRWLGVALIVVGYAMIFAPMLDTTPIGRAITSRLPTRTLLAYRSHGFDGGSLLADSADRVLAARIERDPEARAEVIDFLIASFTTRENDDLPRWLTRWLSDGIAREGFTASEVDRIAEAAWRGAAEKRPLAEWVWVNLELNKPEAAARARERVE